MDGHLKLWKKQDKGIEFVKHYRAHVSPIVGVSASADGQLFASISDDGHAKVFDVINFGPSQSLTSFRASEPLMHYWTRVDMINMIKLGYIPSACCWVHRRGQAQGLLAVCVPLLLSSMTLLTFHANIAALTPPMEPFICTMVVEMESLWRLSLSFTGPQCTL